MNAVARIEPAPTPHDQPAETAALLAVIERAASNPAVDIDKMERLLQMQERVVARHAATEFAAAMAEMQLDMPSIGERGEADRYKFALWEDINKAIKPVLQRHGFSLSFRTDFTSGIKVTGVLMHRCGHREETSIVMPSDGSGSKNAVQAIGSSVSYGKRYTASALLNITSHGEDDDAFTGAAGKTPTLITEQQGVKIREMLESTGSDEAKFLKWLKIGSISDLPAARYDYAMAELRRKEKSKAAT